MFIGGIFFNFIGACTRWLYGTFWRSIAKKKKYTFREYLYGPDDSDEIEDGAGHEIVNRFIGMIVILGIAFLLIRFL